MSLRPESLPLIPDATAAAVRAAFPKGNLYVDLRTEFGTLYRGYTKIPAKAAIEFRRKDSHMLYAKFLGG